MSDTSRTWLRGRWDDPPSDSDDNDDDEHDDASTIKMVQRLTR